MVSTGCSAVYCSALYCTTSTNIDSCSRLLLYDMVIQIPTSTGGLLVYNMAIRYQHQQLPWCIAHDFLPLSPMAPSIPLNHRITNWSVPGKAA